MSEILFAVSLYLSVALVVAGVAAVSLPAASIVAGCLLVPVSWFVLTDDGDSE